MTSSTPHNSARRRITGAALLVACGAVTAAALAAPASAAPAAPAPSPASTPTWVAIAFSPDSGDTGWATGYGTEDLAKNNAISACTAHGGKQCQIQIAVDDCAALASVNSSGSSIILTAAGEGATLQVAIQNAVGFDGTLITAHCSSEPQGTGGIGTAAPHNPPNHIPITREPAAPGRL